MVFNKAKTGRIAIELDARLPMVELRAFCDRFTGYSLSSKQLQQLAEWVEENPVYQSLPPLTTDQPQLPETSLES
jgi:hypothetical protein